MSDNEHAAPSLGNSEVLSVKNPVGEPIPEFCQPPEEGPKSPSSVDGQDTGDVLPKNPLGAILPSDCKIREHEVSSWVSKSLSKPRDAEALAGGSSDENIESWDIFPLLELRDVAQVGHVGIVMRENRAGELLDLGHADAFPSEGMPCDRGRLDAREDR